MNDRDTRTAVTIRVAAIVVSGIAIGAGLALSWVHPSWFSISGTILGVVGLGLATASVLARRSTREQAATRHRNPGLTPDEAAAVSELVDRYGRAFARWAVSARRAGGENLRDFADRVYEQWAATQQVRDLREEVHEAGHALACFAFGGVIERTSVPREDGDALGGPCEWLGVDGSTRSVTDRRFQQLVITLSGLAAEAHAGSTDTWLSRGDLEDARNDARLIALTGVRPTEYHGAMDIEGLMAGAYAQASELVLEHWTSIDGLARALSERPDLRDRQIHPYLPEGGYLTSWATPRSTS